MVTYVFRFLNPRMVDGVVRVWQIRPREGEDGGLETEKTCKEGGAEAVAFMLGEESGT